MENFFQSIINCPDENIEGMIIEKVKELEESPSTDRKIIIPNETLYGHESYYHGFIKNDVKIYFSMGSAEDEYYTLNNYDYLVSFSKFIKENKINNISDAIKNMSSFLDQYFGEYCGTDKRADYIRNTSHTIDAFKSTGLAACSERSAVANNIISMLGMNSFFVTGKVNDEQHAFNMVLNNRGQYILVDTTDCCGIYDSDNNLIGKVTYMYNMGSINDKLEGFLLNGEAASLYDTIARKNEDGSIKYEKNGRLKKYSVEPILLEENIEDVNNRSI